MNTEAIKAKLLASKKVKITIEAEQNDTHYTTAAKDCGENEAGFIEGVKKNLRSNSTWGWCTVVVTAQIGNLTGTAYLGGCSYTSKTDFIKNSGYYEQMKDEAIDELAQELAEIVDVIEA